MTPLGTKKKSTSNFTSGEDNEERFFLAASQAQPKDVARAVCVCVLLTYMGKLPPKGPPPPCLLA